MAVTAIQELFGLVIPPEKPINATGDWKGVEDDLGLALPTDYKLFVERYGSGSICSVISIDTPFGLVRTATGKSMTPRESWLSSVGLYHAWAESGREIPYALYPQKPGLLPCGSFGDVNMINWYTSGEPDNWPVVYFSRWEGFFELQGTGLVAFLVALLKGRSPLPTNVINTSSLRLPCAFKQS